MGMLPEEAAKYAGSKDNPTRYVQNVMENWWVKQQVKEIRDELEAKMEMSRTKVQDMVVKAYDMAEIQALPGDMIRACSELNKMLGYYAPEEKTLNVKSSQLAEDLSTMDEEELLRLAGEEADAIEGEFEELDDIHMLEQASVG